MHVAYYLGTKEENPKSDFFDRSICFFTRSRYSHVELVYELDIVSKIGKGYSSSTRSRGIRGKTIDFSTGRWEVYEIETDRTAQDVIDWFMPRDGLKYDYLGAVGSAFPPLFHWRHRYFCSEAVLECLGYEKPWTYTPGEMFKMMEGKQKRII